MASRGLSLRENDPPDANAAVRVARNTLGQVGARTLSLAASLVAIPILTRYFGPTLFGQFSLVLTLNALLLSVTDLGIQTIATREAAEHPESTGVLAQQAVLLRTAASILLTLVAIAIVSLSRYPLTVRLGFVLLAPVVLFNAFTTGFAVILQSSLRLDRLALAEVAGRLITALSVIVVVLIAARAGAARETALYGTLAASVLGAAASLLLIAVAVGRSSALRGNFRPDLAGRLAREAAPLAAVVVTSLLIYRLDTIILSWLRGAYDVGIYNAAYRFQDLLLAVPALFMTSVFPLLSAQLADAERFRRTWQRALDTLFLTGVPIGLGLFVTAPQLVSLFMGRQFAAAVEPLETLSFAVLLSYINYAYAYSLIIARRQLAFLLINVVGVALNATLNLIFIPAYSYNAAAGITVVSELAAVLMAYALATRTYGYSLKFRIGVKALIAGGLMLACLYPIQNISLLLLIPLGITIYLAAASALGAIDLKAVRRQMGQMR